MVDLQSGTSKVFEASVRSTREVTTVDGSVYGFERENALGGSRGGLRYVEQRLELGRMGKSPCRMRFGKDRKGTTPKLAFSTARQGTGRGGAGQVVARGIEVAGCRKRAGRSSEKLKDKLERMGN